MYEIDLRLNGLWGSSEPKATGLFAAGPRAHLIRLDFRNNASDLLYLWLNGFLAWVIPGQPWGPRDTHEFTLLGFIFKHIRGWNKMISP